MVSAADLTVFGPETLLVAPDARLLLSARLTNNFPILQIQKLANARRPIIYKCIDKALAVEADAGLKDYFHRSFEPTIDDAAKTWGGR